jgi:hypothetical protein
MARTLDSARLVVFEAGAVPRNSSQQLIGLLGSEIQVNQRLGHMSILLEYDESRSRMRAHPAAVG